ncbi:TVP38/TMEM64 family protein [Oribacterium sp. oral taxon 102]|uniref:TVP38/TMEM64 family protein n=1 Tax=Oribacterium sp. oral taxon 102 TaxID=671214 RepID=UPI0015B8EAB8|nr:VTT domain-containing protein [Oribacterium sp. oral taxon 102]NWO21404.1 TVP38/TMEM64 family protein [Oribacterium sp. oral taxon 102]
MIGGNGAKRRRLTRLVSILSIMYIVVFFGICLRGFFDGAFRSVESFQEYIRGFGMFAPLFLLSFQAMQVVIPVLPGFVGCAAGAIMFGPMLGFWCNYIGISAGSIIAFFLARRFGTPLLQEVFPREKYRKWAAWSSKSRCYTLLLFLAVLLPLCPDDYLCYLSGVTKMTSRKFIGIILLGKPWCILAYSLGFSLIR